MMLAQVYSSIHKVGSVIMHSYTAYVLVDFNAKAITMSSPEQDICLEVVSMDGTSEGSLSAEEQTCWPS